ncbi:MAG: hypothetical protein ABIN39_00665 [candidate division WOR-3 bacterium]
MKKIFFISFIIFVLFSSVFPQNFSDYKNFKTISSFLKPDSQSYSFSTGFLFNNNYKISYSLLNANYFSKLNDNIIINYGFGYLNYNLKENLILSNIGLTYKKDNFSISLEVGRTFQEK